MRDDAVTTFICLKSCLWLEFSNFLLNTSDALLLFVKSILSLGDESDLLYCRHLSKAFSRCETEGMACSMQLSQGMY